MAVMRGQVFCGLRILLLDTAVCFWTDVGTLPLKHTIGHLPVLLPGFFVGNF
ncbi:hypothetical protein [Leptolyngbya sp. FACHB-711]|uniref:hypothetical protein n=1 Tax=Leptolyngbya sp. ST-U4 TaxID=2933912 RepID=UPI0016831377|nr:hypothetical protein [Cyanobacteria bacterium FACHB-502]MBD2024081.1 hypothetical protein [Leptolyngbya sp. FACHB-711]